MQIIPKTRNLLLKPEIIFVIFSAIICLVTSLVIPPLSHSDPGYHISKSYLMFSDRSETPEELRVIPPDVKRSIIEKNDLLKKPLKISDGVALNINKSVKVWRYDFKGGLMVVNEKVGITDLGHLPQAIGILLARTLLGGSSYNQIYYTGVFFNWLVSTALIFLSIKFVRKFKWAFFVIATIPTITFLSCGLGYDAMTNAICLLFFSIIINLYIQKQAVSRYQLLALTSVCVGAVLTKRTNVLLLLFIPLVPSAVYKDMLPFRYIRESISGLSKKTKHIILSVTGVVVLCVGVLILGKFATKLGAEFNTSPLGGIYEMIKVLFNSIFRNDLAQLHNPNWQRSGPDGVLRAAFTYKVQMPFWAIFLYVISILGVFIKSAEETPRKIIKRIATVSIVIFAVVTLAVWLGMMSMYIDFTRVSGVIDGVQGRYFSAYIILLLPIVIYFAHLSNTKIGISTKYLPVYCIVVASVMNVYALYLMHASYYLNLHNPLFI